MSEDIVDININLENFKDIIERYDEALLRRSEFELGFNVFSLISDTYYKENFHSDIIYELLNPEGKHKEGALFANLFLEYFNEPDKGYINLKNYENVLKINKEHGIEGKRRIDILIFSETNTVIIENKINNAIDMPNQLVAYYQNCIKKGLTVDAIIYISPNGNKTPDVNSWTCKDDFEKVTINNKIIPVAGYSTDSTKSKSIYEWLGKCEKATKNNDVKFIIKQYQHLLKSLKGFVMAMKEVEEYYNKLSQSDQKMQIESITKLHNQLINYYPEKARKKIESDESLKEAYKNFHPEEKKEDSNLLVIDLLGDPTYYLKICFKSNDEAKIEIGTRATWVLDKTLKENKGFTKLFKSTDESWEYQDPKFDFINDFSSFVDKVKEIIICFNEAIK